MFEPIIVFLSNLPTTFAHQTASILMICKVNTLSSQLKLSHLVDFLSRDLASLSIQIPLTQHIILRNDSFQVGSFYPHIMQVKCCGCNVFVLTTNPTLCLSIFRSRPGRFRFNGHNRTPHAVLGVYVRNIFYPMNGAQRQSWRAVWNF